MFLCLRIIAAGAIWCLYTVTGTGVIRMLFKSIHLTLCNYGCTCGLRRIFQCIILHIHLHIIFVIFVLIIMMFVNGKDKV